MTISDLPRRPAQLPLDLADGFPADGDDYRLDADRDADTPGEAAGRDAIVAIGRGIATDVVGRIRRGRPVLAIGYRDTRAALRIGYRASTTSATPVVAVAASARLRRDVADAEAKALGIVASAGVRRR